MSEKKTKATAAKAAKPAVKRVTTKTAKKAAAEPTKKRRTRGKIFGPRTTVTTRFEEDEHEALTEYCRDEKVTTQGYILGLVRADLKKKGRL